jgi:hypothetical protein
MANGLWVEVWNVGSAEMVKSPYLWRLPNILFRL